MEVLWQEISRQSPEMDKNNKKFKTKSSKIKNYSESLDRKSNDYNFEYFPDDKSKDQISRSSLEYLNCENPEGEANTEVSSTSGEEQEIDARSLYMVIVSDGKSNNDVKFHCDVCNLTFSTADEENKHVTTHKPDTCKKCEICHSIMGKNVFDIHMKLHKEAYKQRKMKNTSKCKRCGKLMGKTYLKFHMKMHGTERDKVERLKQCPICNKQVSYYYLKSHIKRIHSKLEENSGFFDETAKKCPICDRSFKSNIFKKHLTSHAKNSKQYFCDQCGQVFKYYSAFQTHRLIHIGDLKYKCQFCPYRGLHLGLLKVHVRTHTKDYLYECSTCSKKFLTKSNLSIHERIHAASNTIVCPECKRGFYTQRNLDKHFNIIHLGIRNVKCEICGKAFGHRDGLLSHQRKVHNRKKSTHIGCLPTYLKVD